jgi:tetratricopeptide (TPR) repeat protein
MPVVLSTDALQERIGTEKQTQLTGDTAQQPHGALTSALHAILERADPTRDTFGDLERALIEVSDDVTLQASDATRRQLVFANELQIRASTLVTRLDEQCTREIIAGLQEVIARREQQGDYWPEGRLNLGIAYACLGQYEDAQRWLDDAVNMFRYPADAGRDRRMAV